MALENQDVAKLIFCILGRSYALKKRIAASLSSDGSSGAVAGINACGFGECQDFAAQGEEQLRFVSAG